MAKTQMRSTPMNTSTSTGDMWTKHKDHLINKSKKI